MEAKGEAMQLAQHHSSSINARILELHSFCVSAQDHRISGKWKWKMTTFRRFFISLFIYSFDKKFKSPAFIILVIAQGLGLYIAHCLLLEESTLLQL